MVNYLLAAFDVSDGIAVAAVLTSVGSLLSALKIAKRQRTFEFRFYQLRMLDPAKATLRRIVIDHDRRMNIVNFLEGKFSLQAHDDLGKLHLEAVTTFHAISHHLPPHKQQALEARRMALDRKWAQEFHQPLTTTSADEMKAYVDAVLQEVEDCLQTLLDNTSTRSANRLW